MKTDVKINLMKSAPFILVCVTMGGTTAIAQNAVSSNGNDFMLEEIVVTAQKRKQSAQDVPISISALNGDSIRERGVAAASDLVGQFANLTSSSANSATVNFNIRGIATDNFQSNINRSVGVYIDEVTQANPFTGVYGVFDTQRVEVLRGPQNTLNGRNTTGGAINFISVKPEIGGGSTGYGNATYGRFNRIDVEGAVGFDVASDMAARIAGQMQLRDGPFTNFALGREGEELGEREKYSLRTQFLWAPGDHTKILLSGRLGINRGTEIGNLANGLIDPGNDLSATGRTATASGPGPTGDRVPLSVCSQPKTLSNYNGPASPCLTIFGTTGSSDFRRVANSSSAVQNIDLFGATLRIDHDFDGATLTSISAYDSLEVNLADDLTGTVSLQATPFQDTRSDTFQQEFRLVSADSEIFRWILGGYFFTESLKQSVAVRQDQNPLTPATGATFGQQFTPFSILDQVDRDISIFAQADYDINDRLTFSGGLRYTNNRKEADSFFGIVLTPINDSNSVGPNAALGQVPGVPLTEFIGIDFLLNQLAIAQSAGVLRQLGGGPPPFIAANFSGGTFFGIQPSVTPVGTGPVFQEINKLSGDLTLKLQILDQANVFFRFASGFKSGAFDTRALAALAGSGANAPVGPETIRAYEIGFKSNTSSNVQFNASAFYYDQKGLQVFSVGDLGPQFLNVPSSRVFGIETEAVWAVLPDTILQVSAGWLDTEITDAGNLVGVEEGHDLRNAPGFSANFTGSHNIIFSESRLNLLATFRYIGEQFDSLNTADDFFSKKEVQTYLNLRATYYFGLEEQYSFAVFGDNLTGEQFCGDIGSSAGAGGALASGFVNSDNALGQSISCQPGNEGVALWGLSLGVKF